MVNVEPGDCLEVIPRLVAEGVVVDAVVTDPPYHLLPTVKRFQATAVGGSSDVERRAQSRIDGLGRLAGGFMGQSWDGGDIAFRPETWAVVASVLRPGGFLLAFGGTRTYHRLTCAIEDSGLVIQDTILWMYGSGFPKRRDMLKPAIELICVAYKPGGKRTLQVEECRIPTEDGNPAWSYPTGAGGVYSHEYQKNSPIAKAWNNFSTTQDNAPVQSSPNGRWPANVCHDGSDEVMEAFAAFGEKTHGAGHARSGEFGGAYDASSYHLGANGAREMGRFGDDGSPARFFYCAKADAQDRWGSRHPTVKPVELMKWLVPLVTPKGGLVLDPFAGSGATGIAAMATDRNAILIEREEQYQSDIRERIAHYEGTGA